MGAVDRDVQPGETNLYRRLAETLGRLGATVEDLIDEPLRIGQEVRLDFD